MQFIMAAPALTIVRTGRYVFAAVSFLLVF